MSLRILTKKCKFSTGCGVRYAVSWQRVVGLISSRETITVKHYQEIPPKVIALLEEDKLYCWLQQNRATAHVTNSMTQMCNFFEECVTAQELWPP
jgi:NADH pyrophosphatase NudC (nudix superfamily)